VDRIDLTAGHFGWVDGALISFCAEEKIKTL
jgi:hypothetical protein